MITSLLSHPVSGSPFGDVLYSNYFEYYGEKAEEMLCLVFPGCNFKCVWCRRIPSHRSQITNPFEPVAYSLHDILIAFEREARMESRLYLTGGDPSLYLENCLEIAQAFEDQFHRKIAYAHNGSSPLFAEKMAAYTHSAAIDLKAASQDEFSYRAGVDRKRAKLYLENWFEVQRILHSVHAFIDIRMPIFEGTTLDDMKRAIEMTVSVGTAKKVLTFRAYRPVPGLNWKPPVFSDLINNVTTLSIRYPEIPMGALKSYGPMRELTLFHAGKEVGLSIYERKPGIPC